MCFKRPECLIQEWVKRKLRLYRKSNAGFRYVGTPILLLNISSGYCIQVICILLMISGIEPNPGPKKQTTLFTEPTPTVKESPDTELKTMIVQMSSEIRNLGERLDTRLSNIEKRIIEWDQRLLGVEMKITTCVETLAATNEIVSENVIKLREIEARTDFLEIKLREPNLVFYGVEGEANEAPAESLQKVKSIIKEKMQILENINITKCYRLGKANKSPILISIPEYEDRIKLFKNTTKLRDSKIYINKDYSKKIRDQRLILIAKRKELFEKGTRSKLRDNKLIVNGVVYEAIDKQISNIVSIQLPFDKTLTAKISKIKNSKVTKNISDRNTTKIRYTHTKNCESAIKDKQLTQAKHIDTKIKMLQWNINGFNRITSIFPLAEYLKKYELFALNETWITGVIELLTDEYYIIQSPAMKTELKGRGSGGILIGIKKTFQHTVRKIETNPYWISVLTHKFLDKTTESICLLFAYLPPNALQEQNLTNLLRHIDYHMSEGNEVLIAGDINIRIGNAGGFHNPLKLNSPLNKYRNSKDLIFSKLSEKLISFTDSNSITIVNGRTKGDMHGSFTFISERGSSVLDYFMYTHGLTQIISDMWIEELSYSDHLPIVLQINTGYEAIKSSYKYEILTRKFIWTKENVEMLKHNLSDIEVGNETDINIETVNFTKQIYTAMESANIIKFAKRRHQLSKPWYDKDCYILKKTTKLLQRKRDEFNKDKNEKIKNAKDPKSFWNAIASFRKKPIIQGEIDIKEWFLFYKNLLNKENKEATFTLNQMIGWKDPDLDAEITLEEIHDVVKKLANGKAVGLDGIPNELLKNLPIPTLTKLKNLFNKIMSTEKYPQLWTNSIVHPIYKSGDKNNPTNYRGIALCSNISKLFTTILRNRLNNWIEKREIILENQAGFRKNRSCTDHILLLNSLIQLSLRRKRGKLYVFFVDLTKAFDTVPHDLLWQKLQKMGISNKFVMLIKNFYQEAKITIRWKGQYSSNVKINSGVLQGESLSPLLFILYMADLIELYNNSALTGFHLPDFGVLHLLMYADDIAIVGESKINLQIKINLLKSYLDNNKLVLNENKSKIMVFRNGGRPARHENWHWGDTPLTVASNITYLGYPFTSTNNSKKVALFYKAKANTAINATIRLIKKEKINSLKVALNLFDSVIKSILLYAAPVWAWDNTDIIDQLQNMFIKNFLNLPRYIPGYIVRLETGRISLTFTTIKLIMKYFIRLQKMEDNRLPKLCWNRLKEISLMTKKTYRILLNYDDIQIELPNILKIKIEQLLQQDLAKLSLTKSYSNYRLLYDSFIPEHYLSCNLSSALITDEIYHFIAECGDLEGERKKILKSLPRPHLNSIKLLKTVSDKKTLERALVTIAHQDNALQSLNKLSITSPPQSHHIVECSVGPAPQATNINISYVEAPFYNPELEDIEDYVEEFKTWLMASKVSKGDWTKALVRRLSLDGSELIKCRFEPSAALEGILETLKLCYPKNNGRVRNRGNELRKMSWPQSTKSTWRYLINLITDHVTAEEAEFLQAAKFLNETNGKEDEPPKFDINLELSDSEKINVLDYCTEKDKKFVIGPAETEAFETLKTKLTEESILSHFNQGARIEIHTDASMVGLGAILMQPDKEGFLYPVITYREPRLNMSKNHSPHWNQWLVVAPKHSIPEIMKLAHNIPEAGHMGVTKTIHSVKQRFYWKGLDEDVRRYIKSCRTCQAFKMPKFKLAVPLEPLPPAQDVWERVGKTFKGHLRNRQKAIPLKNTKAETACNALAENLYVFSTPKCVISNQGKAFDSGTFIDFTKLYGIKHVMASVAHPQTNRLGVKLNAIIKNSIRTLLEDDHAEWTKFVKSATFVYNSSVQSSMKVTPHRIAFGREPRT
ncbi:hypothetical protein LAZ67_X001306 [Cordylochernes scorpioides]|uniref:Reverse transcriptase n=1 Tax=Cordylochernes scorpioides TaxID=51811 RepID=A0ABY6LSS2_9ARAC|nr:hypothetical protein LAZ67_X001306 [Cordylochernes scorpioides]